MKTPLIEKLTEYRIESGLSYDKLGDKTGISASTICRWYKGQGVPSLDEIELLCDAMGHDIADIFVTVGKQEMVATQAIGYQGAEVMVEHYEARLKAKDEKYDLLKEHHSQRIEELNNSHRRTVDYLKDEISRLRDERDSARGTSLAVVDKKHKVFAALVIICVVMGIAISLLIVLLIIAFKTDAII